MPPQGAGLNSEKDILCIGETMVLLTSSTGEPLETSATLDVHVAGAESNVAAGMSHLGQSVSWFGRVGDDSLGQRVRGALSHHGIDISMSEDDPHRHTGLYLKDHALDIGQICHVQLDLTTASWFDASTGGRIEL